MFDDNAPKHPAEEHKDGNGGHDHPPLPFYDQARRDAQAGRLNPDDITDRVVASYLNTRDMPDPDLLIRTSGELRISNFLLWQLAYTELYFTDTNWPDFRKENFYQAIYEYQQRERRFGK